MPIIDFSNPYYILVALVLYVLIVYLAREIKRSNVTCIMLLAFLTIIAGHAIEYVMGGELGQEVLSKVANSIAIDFVFVFLSFIAYLWTDDIEAKDKKIKSVDNSLDWFWKKV